MCQGVSDGDSHVCVSWCQSNMCHGVSERDNQVCVTECQMEIVKYLSWGVRGR